jgi:hypothetical protein
VTIPKPQRVTAHHLAAWAYVTVPAEEGLTSQVQYQTTGASWTDASLYGSDFLVPMQQTGNTEFRARYVSPDGAGEWTTGRVWMPNGFELDSDQGTKPEPPADLRASGIGGTSVRLDWRKPDVEPDSWRVSWRRDGQQSWSTRAVRHSEARLVEDRYTFSVDGLSRYADYDIAVHAVVGGVESDPAELFVVTTARTDGEYGPANPYNGAAEAVTDTTATITWEQDDPRAVENWLIGIAGVGQLQQGLGQQYTLTGLSPSTDYIVEVFAVGFDGALSATSATVHFRTTGADSDTTRPGWIRKTPAASATTLAVEWERRGDETQWSVQLDDQPLEFVPGDDDPSFSWTGLEPGSEHTVQVRCKVGSSWLPRETARRERFVLDADEPRPRPQPPTGLHVHCIADISAKAEWDSNAGVDAWEVWLDDDREHGAETTVTPLVKLQGLQPETTYTVNVVAVRGYPGEPGYAESDPATLQFTTLATVLPPEPSPPPDIPADLPAPTGLMVRSVDASTVDAWWDDARPDTGGANFYIASVDGIHWERTESPQIRFTDLQPGRHTVHVYGVFGLELTAIARKAATMKESA